MTLHVDSEAVTTKVRVNLGHGGRVGPGGGGGGGGRYSIYATMLSRCEPLVILFPLTHGEPAQSLTLPSEASKQGGLSYH